MGVKNFFKDAFDDMKESTKAQIAEANERKAADARIEAAKKK